MDVKQIAAWVIFGESVTKLRVPHDADISDLKYAVKSAFEPKLNQVAAADIIIQDYDREDLPVSKIVFDAVYSSDNSCERPFRVSFPVSSRGSSNVAVSTAITAPATSTARNKGGEKLPIPAIGGKRKSQQLLGEDVSASTGGGAAAGAGRFPELKRVKVGAAAEREAEYCSKCRAEVTGATSRFCCYCSRMSKCGEVSI